VKVGWIHKDELVEKKLKMGDVLHIDAGSTFYMVNTGEGQRLQVICSIDASDSAGFGPYQVMYIYALFILHLQTMQLTLHMSIKK
jgi:hypothetical protein